MTLVEMLSNIRTELADAGSNWTDAELTRAVRKSVSLMSRIQPDKSIAEVTIGGNVSDESFTTPATADPDAIVDAKTLNGKTAGSTLTIADRTPDVPRRLTMALTDGDASVTTLVIIVKGYNENKEYIEEIWGLKDLLVSGTSYQGKLYFSSISEVEVDSISGVAAAEDIIDIGTGNAYDSYVELANRGIKYDSETVTNAAGTTEYKRDTDYTIDYINGRIKFINGGSMAAGTAYLIDYSLDPRVIDVETVLTKGTFLKVERIEHPVGHDPAVYVTPEYLGNNLIYLKGSEVSLGEQDHSRLLYAKPWIAPGNESDGNYPEHLDDVVIIGACGQALLIKAEKYVQQAISEIELTNAAADSMATPLADINTALDRVYTYLANNTNDDAAAILANITDDVAELRTAIETALDTYATYVTGAVAPGANYYLSTGDDKITTINDADRVAENYADYARAALQIFQTLIAEATTRLSNLRSYIEEAAEWRQIGETFVAEATQRVNEVYAWAAQADRYVATSNQYLAIASRYLASGQSKINEMLIALGVKAESITAQGGIAQFS